MATIVLGAAGSALGASIGGSFLGTTASAWGRAIGASVGGLVDQRLSGPGNSTVENGKIDSFRFQNAVEGQLIGRTFGRNRLAGNVIWASDFYETLSSTKSGGGKFNSTPSVTTKSYSYSISIAIALCEGEILKVGRIWADGEEINAGELPMTVYTGSADQNPDTVISSHLGAENTPAFRNTAYVVFDNLQLAPYGNRVPQFNFEVFRRAEPKGVQETSLNEGIKGVALMPGSGEYVMATTPVNLADDYAVNQSANVHTNRGDSDLVHAVRDLQTELPNSNSVVLVTSWFGDDLRCSECQLEPKIEQDELDGAEMPWVVSGETRDTASIVSRQDDRPVFGGTPCDESVLEAISKLNSEGQSVVFYPFIMMDIQQGNALPDPWGEAVEQPAIPWRGRITASLAPDQVGTPDKTSDVRSEIDSFFGTADVSDFEIDNGEVTYNGPSEWSYRRFILHYATLCAQADGVDAFCIGSEMRSLTQLRDENNGFPAVEQLMALATDVRQILGDDVKIGYAADWSEYFGYQPSDGSGDLFFHLDGLWASDDIDFVGIDNYMPLSDWRESSDHLDSHWGEIYNPEYLKANVEGGEGYDWFYANSYDREVQNRSPITDGAYDEPWVYRYKDMRSWWGQYHYNRIGGIRDFQATDWVPQSKPIWFTEFGFPAVDKGTNQPNVFIDPKSSESAAPYFSNLEHDPEIQFSGLRAVIEYWGDDSKNPVSEVYDGRMIDMDRAHVWAWDARPWPDFPLRKTVWSDGDNHELGHWISGRMGGDQLDRVVAEICETAGVTSFDVTSLNKTIDGFWMKGGTSAREALEVLMSVFNFDCFEVEGTLVFEPSLNELVAQLEFGDLVLPDDQTEIINHTRNSSVEVINQISFGRWDGSGDYQFRQTEARSNNNAHPNVMRMELPIVMRNSAAARVVDRVLNDQSYEQETISFALPLSAVQWSVGDVIQLRDVHEHARFKVVEIEELGHRIVNAVRVRSQQIVAPSIGDVDGVLPEVIVPNPVFCAFLQLPLLSSDEESVGAYIAATATPWPGGVSVYSDAGGGEFDLEDILSKSVAIGETLGALPKAYAHRWAEQSLLVKVVGGALSSANKDQILAGENQFAIKIPDTEDWEIVQYQNASLNSDGNYLLSGLLRGQRGTDALMPSVYPDGSQLVFLKEGLGTVQADSAEIGVMRALRYGPSNLPLSNTAYREHNITFAAVGLRPFSPVHLKSQTNLDGDTEIRWIRRTRAVGDYWGAVDVPVHEAKLEFSVSISMAGIELRRETTTEEKYIYDLADKQSDGALGAIDVDIAQISGIYGLGPSTRITINV